MLSRLPVFCILLAVLGCISANLASGASHHVKVSGVRTGINHKQHTDQKYPARRNLVDLVNDAQQWSLFVQAYNAFQQVPENDTLSYFQIAGIHGRPYYAWNDAPQGPSSPLTGYCTHSDNLFLTWHRPYLALYEQTIAKHAQEIAKNYAPDIQPIWQVAADHLRIPYWDWATGLGLPDIVNQPHVQITNTSSQLQMVNNPFYQYTFQGPLDKTWFPGNESDGWLAEYRETLRGVDHPGGQANIGRVKDNLAQFNFKNDTWLSLTKNAGAFNDFCTTSAPGSSIEAIHNNVQYAKASSTPFKTRDAQESKYISRAQAASVGGWNGHMSFLSYSAMDPLFWLHHTNVDRQYAIWQALNPNSFVTPSTERGGTFALAPGQLEDENTELSPFSLNGRAPYYTSAATRYTSTFGYTYPEIPDWALPADQLARNVSVKISALYGPDEHKFKRSVTGARQISKQWFVKVEVDKFDTQIQGERFQIHVFVGNVPRDPKAWFGSSNHVGLTTIFPPPSRATIKLSAHSGTVRLLAYSEFSLVRALTTARVNMEDEEAVKKYLKENLRWRVQLFNGTHVPSNKVKSLCVTVHHELVAEARLASELPLYSNATAVPEITAGQTSGMSGTG